MTYMLVMIVAFVIGAPGAFAAETGEANPLKNDPFDNDKDQDEVTDGLEDDSFVQDAPERNSTRIRLRKTIYHRSGVRFPDDLVDRFQLDLAGQKTFKKCESDWGPSRPKMPRAIKGESRNRQLIQSAAMFWDRVSAKGALVYAHHYHPDWKGNDGKYGIDCSNFVAHVYNLVLGVTITSGITELSKLRLPHVTKWEKLQPGDVALFQNMAKTGVVHTGIVVEGDGKPSVVHSTGGKRSGPQLSSKHDWWPINRFAYGFRLQDLIGCKEPECTPQTIRCHKMPKGILV